MPPEILMKIADYLPGKTSNARLRNRAIVFNAARKVVPTMNAYQRAKKSVYQKTRAFQISKKTKATKKRIRNVKRRYRPSQSRTYVSFPMSGKWKKVTTRKYINRRKKGMRVKYAGMKRKRY